MPLPEPAELCKKIQQELLTYVSRGLRPGGDVAQARRDELFEALGMSPEALRCFKKDAAFAAWIMGLCENPRKLFPYVFGSEHCEMLAELCTKLGTVSRRERLRGGRLSMAVRTTTLSEGVHTGAAKQDDPYEAAALGEDLIRLEEALAALPNDQAQAIGLHLEDKTQREIAHAMGLTQGTVSKIIWRARKNLERALGQDLSD
jgi:RNA polymerase sigma factor (sigma-70 family)